ncbi:MAG TPA: hypothetical protein VMM92_06270 [Thermoanaerobaculia bacterium]|nr:hypothetical protein [Thermoanaerobaculia bacterium]
MARRTLPSRLLLAAFLLAAPVFGQAEKTVEKMVADAQVAPEVAGQIVALAAGNKAVAEELIAQDERLRAIVPDPKARAAAIAEGYAESRRATEVAEITNAEQQFMGIQFGVGVGVVSDLQSGKRVDSARVVNGIVRVEETSNAEPRVFLEVHNFINDRDKVTTEDPRLFGHGPWVGIQSSNDQIIDAFAIGWMFGWRRRPQESTSFNLALGLVLDPKVKVLGDGLQENKPLPNGETEIRYKTESRVGAVLLASFSF